MRKDVTEINKFYRRKDYKDYEYWSNTRLIGLRWGLTCVWREQDPNEDDVLLRGRLLKGVGILKTRMEQRSCYWNSFTSALETSLGDWPKDGFFCPSLDPSPASCAQPPYVLSSECPSACMTHLAACVVTHAGLCGCDGN